MFRAEVALIIGNSLCLFDLVFNFLKTSHCFEKSCFNYTAAGYTEVVPCEVRLEWLLNVSLYTSSRSTFHPFLRPIFGSVQGRLVLVFSDPPACSPSLYYCNLFHTGGYCPLRKSGKCFRTSHECRGAGLLGPNPPSPTG